MTIDLIFKQIEEFATAKFGSIKSFVEILDYSENGYYAAKRTGDLKLTMLLKMADVLDVSINDLFKPADLTISILNDNQATYGLPEDTLLKLLKRIDKTTQQNLSMLKKISGDK